jgi:beta-glucosidase/6-phospho-beta-glucosidase/beta-galactosidase
MIGSFESTYQPEFDVDVLESTGHATRWREDLELLRACGVTELRYPIRWHRIERFPGSFDWAETDEVLGFMRETGLRPIVDLLHHTSYPRWVGDFASPGFGPAFLRYTEAFAARYPWVGGYTLFNEPFTTFLLSGQEAIWPPYMRGLDGFLQLVRNVFPALTAASRMYRDLLADARHFYVEVCERAEGASVEGAEYAEYTNDRRFFLTDLFLGRDLAADRPFVADVIAAGGEDVLGIPPGHIDVLGLDYYAHNQWHWSAPGVGSTCAGRVVPLSELIAEYWERYRLPCIIGETNIRGYSSDRATWLKYVLEQCELARDRGVRLEGLCWFPFVDSTDWDSILCRCDGTIDPVGVYWLDEDLERRESSMSAAYRLAASGAAAAELPAYELQPPVSAWLARWLPHMRHWEWLPAPENEILTEQVEIPELELRVAEKGA